MQPKLGLYSVSYAGLWYSGRPLTIKEFIDRAKLFKYDCVELDCRVPHAVPYHLSQKDRKEIVNYLEKKDMPLAALAANNDFSSPVTEHREANIQMVVDMIQLVQGSGSAGAAHFHRLDGLQLLEWPRNIRGCPAWLCPCLPANSGDGSLEILPGSVQSGDSLC